MKKVFLFFLVLGLVFTSNAYATLWDFDSFTNGTNINGVNLGGVTITAPDDIALVIDDYQTFSGTASLAASYWTEGMTLTLTFDSFVDSVSIYGGDYGGDSDRFSMTAYNEFDNQIAFADTGSFSGADPNPVPGWSGDYRYLSLSANNISYVVLEQVTWGTIWDNLYAETTSVPEPATMFLLGTGLLGVAVVRRKIRK